jgi:hypothetical protein
MTIKSIQDIFHLHATDWSLSIIHNDRRMNRTWDQNRETLSDILSSVTQAY